MSAEETRIEWLERLLAAAREAGALPCQMSDDSQVGYWLAETEEHDAEWVGLAECYEPGVAELFAAVVNALPALLELARAADRWDTLDENVPIEDEEIEPEVWDEWDTELEAAREALGKALGAIRGKRLGAAGGAD